MEIKDNVALAPYTTFNIGGPARFFCVVKNSQDALEAYEFAKEKNVPTFVLGGGSNLLVSDKGFYGLVMKVENRGVEVLLENETDVLLKIGSGENWDSLVSFTVTNGWWGIENLSHIPGSSGAIAVQNVGAYGQEARQVIDSVLAFDRHTGHTISIKNTDCGFGYRFSIFNTTEKGRYIIFHILMKLSKYGQPNLSYWDLKNRFAEKSPNLKDIRPAVIEIRNKKFPFPEPQKNGNAGSFFKNVIMRVDEFLQLADSLENDFGTETAEAVRQRSFFEADTVKVPAAFLVDLCGLKGLSVGGALINSNQPLVIVNAAGKATSNEVLALAQSVRESVHKKTGIWLAIEPEFVGFGVEELRHFGF